MRSGVVACYGGPGFVTIIGIFCTDIFLSSLKRFVDLRRRHPVLPAGTFQDIIPEGSRQMMDILFQKLEYLTRMLPQRSIRIKILSSFLLGDIVFPPESYDMPPSNSFCFRSFGLFPPVIWTDGYSSFSFIC